MKKVFTFVVLMMVAIASSFAEYVVKKTDNGDRSYTVVAYSTKASKYDFFTCENVYDIDIGFDVDIHMFSSDVQNCFWESWYALVYTYKTDETGCIVDISDTALIWANNDGSYHMMHIKSAWLFIEEDVMAAKSLID
jgi:hypothetical protein